MSNILSAEQFNELHRIIRETIRAELKTEFEAMCEAEVAAENDATTAYLRDENAKLRALVSEQRKLLNGAVAH